MTQTRHLTVLVIVCLLAVAGLAVVAPTAAAGDAPAAQTNETDACEGNPQMSQTSITSPQDRITADEPGVVEANFRVDPTLPEECTVIVDLEFSFSESGFQFGGGAEWEQSTTDLVATQFEVSPGEIRDIRGELHTNGAGPGDEVTVIADYEIWYEGDRENSRQQTIRHTIEVEEPNPADNGAGEDNGAHADQGESETELLIFLEDNLLALGIVVVAIVAVIGLIKREPIFNIFTE